MGNLEGDGGPTTASGTTTSQAVKYYWWRGRKFKTQKARSAFIRSYNRQMALRRQRSRGGVGRPQRLPQRYVNDSRDRLRAEQLKAQKLRQELKRRADAIAAEKRRQAYVNLRKRYQHVLSRASGRDRDGILAEKMKAREVLDPVKRQKALAAQYEAREGEVVRARRNRVTQGGLDRVRALQAARETGDYEKLLRRMRKQQEDTGGRYLDRKLYDRALKDYNERQKLVDQASRQATERAYKLAGWTRSKGAWVPPKKQSKAQVRALRTYLASDEYRQAIAAWKRVYGDGRKPGQAHAVAKLFRDISVANDDYFTRAVFGYADSTSRAGVDAARREIDKKLTRYGGGGRSYKISLKQYLDELAAQEREIMSTAQRQAQAYFQNARKEGYIVNDDGSIVSKDWVQTYRPTIERALGKTDADRMLEQLAKGSSVDRERALDIIVNRTVDQRRSELFAKYGTSQAHKQEILAHLDAFRNGLYQRLTGGNAPQGLERLLGGALHTPLLGEVLKGLGFLGGGLTGAIRYGQTGIKNGQFVGGRIQTADLNLSALTELGKPGAKGLITRDFHSSEEELKGEAQAKLDFAKAIEDAHGDAGKIIEAIIAYGAEPFQGNIGNFAASAVLDPTIALNLTKFLKAGQLAKVRQGSVSALLLHPGESLADLYKLSLPKSLGGYGRSAFTLRETLHDLSRTIGKDIKEVAQLDPDITNRIFQSLLEHPRTTKEATSFLAKQFNVTPANAAQILASVQAYASKKGGAVGLRVVDAQTFEKHLRAADSAARTVPAQAAKGLRSLRTEASATRDTVLAARVREVRTGTPSTLTVRTATGPAKVELDRAREAVRTIRERQIQLATTAKGLARTIRSSTDGRLRIHEYEKLTRVLDELDDLTAKSIDPDVPTTVTDRAYARYQEKLLDAGTLQRPHLADHTHTEIVRDLRFVDRRIKAARAELKAALPADRPAAQKKLRDLAAARRVLDEARQRHTSQARVAKEVVKRGRRKAEEYVRRPRVAAKAETREGVVEEGSRDLYRRFRGAKVKAAPTLSSAERTKVREAVKKLSRPVDWSSPVLVSRAELDGLDLWESIVALDAVVAKGNTFYGPELAELMRQAGDIKTIRQLLDDYRLLHNSIEGIDLPKFTSLFKRIQAEFRKAGINERKGSVRFYDQADRPPSSANIDYGLAETVAKMKALRGTGVTLHAYDEVRGPLGDVMVKMNSSEGLRKAAIARAKKTGETFDEAYEALYAVKHTREAAEALHEFAMRPAFRGSLPDEILDLWEESQIRQDLKVGKVEVTPFLHRSLRKSIAVNSKVGLEEWVDDPAYMGRVLGGNILAPEGMRLAEPGERLGIADSVPVFVAPSDHPHFGAPDTKRGHYQHMYGIVLNEKIVQDGRLVKTALHEYGHALWAAADKSTLPANTIILEVPKLIAGYDTMLKGYLATTLSHPQEYVAELYAMWIGRHVNLDFTDLSGKVKHVPSWADLRSRLAPADQLALDRIGAAFDQLPPPIAERDFGVGGANVPPFTSRPEAYQWLVDNGFWARRTGQRIREGGQVWSIDQEREFFETSFGFSPPWTDRELIGPALDDPRYFNELMTQFGYLDNGFELHAAALNLDADGLAQAIAFGSHEAEGIKRGRTRQELRDWFAARFGDLVVEEVPTPAGGKTTRFRTAPWLMDAGDAEYKAFVDRMIDDGRILNPTLVKPEQMAKFKDAYKKAIDRRLARLVKLGKVKPGEDWLPQEQMRFAIDVTNELLMSREWRSFTERAPVGHRALRWVGELQRLMVVAQIAFPVMNLIDRFTSKQVLLMVANSGYRFWQRIDEDAARTLNELRAINIHERGIWDLRTASGWERLKNSELDRKTRTLAVFDTITELGYSISSWGEDSLKLNFAQRVYMQIRDDLIAEGVERDQARALALTQARKKVLAFFPSLEDASELERAMNQLVPFMSYNLRNNLIGLKIVAGHPYLWNLQNQIGALIEDSNRTAWEEQNPGVELPDKYARRLLLRVSDQTYAMDFANFSDWFRGPERFSNESKDPDTIYQWLTTWIRIPHPAQAAAYAWLTGGETPWGTQASVSSFIPLADFFPTLFGPGETEGYDPFQFLTKQLFFEAFAKVTVTEARAAMFFDLLRAGERDKANALLDTYPDVEMWIQDRADPNKFVFREAYKRSWFKGKTPQEVDAYEAAKKGLQDIRNAFDAELRALYDQPWSDEYKRLKKERRAAVLAYTLAHPELIDVRVLSMSEADWADETWGWYLDDLVDDFFAADERMRPVRGDFKDELAYLRAVRDYLDWRKSWAAAHPSAQDQITRGVTSLEHAWNMQQEHWRDIEREQVEVRIAIAQEQAKGAKGDKDLIDALYDLSDQNYARLDAEAFADVYSSADGWLPKLRSGAGLLTKTIAGKFELPGRADFFFDAASEAEKKVILGNERYQAKFDAIVEKGTKDFYGELERAGILKDYLKRHPAKRINYEAWRAFRDGGASGFYPLLIRRGFLDEYLAANPEKRDNYERWAAFNGGTGTAGLGRYARGIMAIFRASKDGRDFYRRLDQDPWLKAEYFRRNPDKATKYFAGRQYFNAMKRWVSLLQADKFDEASRYFSHLPAWIRERYYAKHPDRRRGAVASSGYAAAMGKWVGLLKAKKYDEARRFFDGMPEAYRQRYFAKHPEARARFGGDDRMLEQARGYFSADKATQADILRKDPAFAKWLRANGGSEEARRGLILAAYRSIGKGGEWLRRVYRELYPEIFSQEALGEQRLKKVARRLAEHPELFDLYNEWVEAQWRAYSEQYKLSVKPPKALEVERVRRWQERDRRRSARFSPLHRSAA